MILTYASLSYFYTSFSYFQIDSVLLSPEGRNVGRHVPFHSMGEDEYISLPWGHVPLIRYAPAIIQNYKN